MNQVAIETSRSKPEVTISIVVTGKAGAHLEKCLLSLDAAAQQTVLRVYVVNNCVEFDLNKLIQKCYPKARIIENKGRRGFGTNHNQILRRCQTEYALILNDDTQLGENCIDLMYRFMEENPQVGLAGAALYEGSWNGSAQTGGGLTKTFLPAPVRILLITLAKSLGLSRLAQKYVGHKGVTFDLPRRLGFISGACLMVRKKILDQIGLFDEEFYIYLEDVDLGKRARRAGWECYQVLGAKIVHIEAASASAQTYQWVAQSAQYYARKHHGLFVQIIVFLLATPLRIISWISSTTKRRSAKEILVPSRLGGELYRDYPKNILAMKLGGIGDVIMITPALRSLKARFPQAWLTLMAEKSGAEVVRGLPYVDELLTFTEFYTYHGYYRFFSLRFLSQGYNLIKTLLKRRFDIFIEFQNLINWKGIIKPMLIGYLSQAPVRVGFNTDQRGFFLTTRVPDIRLKSKHMIDRALEVIKELGAEVDDPNTEIWISEEDRSYAQDFLTRHLIRDNDLLIGIHPGGNPRELIRRCWPEERFSQVADTLTEKYQAKNILIGGPQEVALVNKVASLMKSEPILLAGAMTIKQLAAIIERCDLFIGNDTGPMHIAVAMKVPTIGIFGPGDWQMYGTYPPETNFIMLRKPIDCWPCRNLKCSSRACFKLITVEDVLEAVNKQIEHRRGLSKCN